MFMYEKKLQYPVKIKTPNPKLASVIISQYGGPNLNRLRLRRVIHAVPQCFRPHYTKTEAAVNRLVNCGLPIQMLAHPVRLTLPLEILPGPQRGRSGKST